MKEIVSKYIYEIKNVAQKGFFHLFRVNGLIYLIGFASQLIVAGLLDPVEIGRIKIMQAYVGITSLIVGLGFNTSMIKRLSTVNSSLERSKILQITLLISSFTFVVVYAILLVVNRMRLLSPDNVVTKVFPFYALYLLPLGLQSMLVAFYQAGKQIKKMATILFYAKVVTVVLILICTFFIGLKGYILAILVGAIISNVILVYNLSNKAKLALFSSMTIKRNDIAQLWDLAKFVLAANILGNLVTTLDIYFVNYFIEDRYVVGYYMFALTMVGAMNIFPATVQQISFPYFSGKFIDIEKWHQTYKKYNLINHVFLFIVFVVALVSIPVLVKIIFRGKYDQSLIFLPFLLIWWLLNYLNNIRGTALMGAGRFDLNLIAGLVTLGVTLCVLLVLGHYFHLKGVLAAKIISGLVAYISSYLIFRKYLVRIGLLKVNGKIVSINLDNLS